uniref:Male reproductive-related protein Mar-Mrr n=1 Tax=Macrobrachium rosenbergii TaxID=79674 RepID=B8LG46_MACRS|nr:male reproductive-related protein Mar-Mrr [Macrobrachium rosenbergii]ABQ41240.1 male reproductive-related protein Mar-Mrr [Macrobrachium rosenbergii]
MASFFKLISVMVMVAMGFILVSEAASDLQDAAVHDYPTVLEIIGSPRMKRSPHRAESGFYGSNRGMEADFFGDSGTYSTGYGLGGLSRLTGKFSGEGEFAGGAHSGRFYD